MAGVAIFSARRLRVSRTFVALGNAKCSLFLACLRKLILLIPLVYLLPLFIPDTVFAIFLAEPIADVLAVLCTVTLLFACVPQNNAGDLPRNGTFQAVLACCAGISLLREKLGHGGFAIAPLTPSQCTFP